MLSVVCKQAGTADLIGCLLVEIEIKIGSTPVLMTYIATHCFRKNILQGSLRALFID